GKARGSSSFSSRATTSSAGAAGTRRARSTSSSSANRSAAETPDSGSLITGRRNVHYDPNARNTPPQNAHSLATSRPVWLAPQPAESAGLSSLPRLSDRPACEDQLRRRGDRQKRRIGRSRRNRLSRRRPG